MFENFIILIVANYEVNKLQLQQELFLNSIIILDTKNISFEEIPFFIKLPEEAKNEKFTLVLANSLLNKYIN
jgi:hypothetical protein